MKKQQICPSNAAHTILHEWKIELADNGRIVLTAASLPSAFGAPGPRPITYAVAISAAPAGMSLHYHRRYYSFYK